MPWSLEEKLFVVNTYLRLRSFVLTQRLFKQKFKTREFPDNKNIYRWVLKFRTSGTILNEKTKRRPLSVRTENNIATVSDSVAENPSTSVRRRSQELGIPRESLRKILRFDLTLYPYHIQIKQKLTYIDMVQRIRMCEWFSDRIQADHDFLDDLWFSDEAHFLLSGCVNSKNNVYWGNAKPDFCMQRPLHSVKCTAWVALSKHGIIGPFWFEDTDTERALTVNTERYIDTLEKFWTALG